MVHLALSLNIVKPKNLQKASSAVYINIPAISVFLSGMNLPKKIVWYRNDLRMHDHDALEYADKDAEVVPVYVVQEKPSYMDNFQRIGKFRQTFLNEALEDLRDAWMQRGLTFTVLHGAAHVCLVKFALEQGVTEIVAHREYAFEEMREEEHLSQALQGTAIKLTFIHGGFLIHPDDLPFELHQLPDIFTAFRKKVEALSPVRKVTNTGVPKNEFKPSTQASADPRQAIAFRGGERAGLQRVQHYLWNSKAVEVYKETRNGLIGADYSSKFSPWLALGCLSPRYVYAELKRYEKERIANESTYWLVFELLWRDYFRYVMMKFGPRLFMRAGLSNKTFKKSTFNYTPILQQWINGQTGDDFVDANMRELKLTGFMSNRGRQNVASYFVHQLKLDWRLGAAYFEEQLIDYDVYSNWGNWAYLAGVGNDPRENRVFNTQKQAEMYDGAGLYRKLWLAEN
jgi:deoxyribodipyrimidine photo-lyase